MRMGNSLFIFVLLMIGLERKKRLPCGRYHSRHATLFLMEHKLRLDARESSENVTVTVIC